MVYNEAKGRLESAAGAARSILFLETVEQNLADTLGLAGFLYIGNAKLRLSQRPLGAFTHKLPVCCELATDFAELFRAYGGARVNRGKRKSNDRWVTVASLITISWLEERLV